MYLLLCVQINGLIYERADYLVLCTAWAYRNTISALSAFLNSGLQTQNHSCIHCYLYLTLLYQ